MSTALPGQTVVVIGGSAGIGLETARRARAEGADVILTGRNPDRLARAAAELGALGHGTVGTAAFDATDPAALDGFFSDLPGAIDHVMVTGPGPYYAPLAELDRERAHRDFDAHVWLTVAVAQHAVGRVRPGGTLLFIGGTGGRSRGPGLSLIAAGTAALPALIANLAVEVAPVRVNLIAAGFVDTPLSVTSPGLPPYCYDPSGVT
jgi:NAD(P)-dependent dehydrogenase (short-subunit alcohol dehydrogenase family)